MWISLLRIKSVIKIYLRRKKKLFIKENSKNDYYLMELIAHKKKDQIVFLLINLLSFIYREYTIY